MKRAMRATFKLLQARYLFQQLIRKGIGTTPVEELSRRTCHALPHRRTRTLVNIVMQWKIADARKSMNRARSQNTQIWRECKPILRELNILQQFNDIWSMEKQTQTNRLRNLRRRKATFLTEKYTRDARVPDVLHSIVIADQDFIEDFSTSPRTYGGVRLTQEEEALLALPPKFSTFEEIDPIECEMAVEKSLGKIRWEINNKQREERGEPTEDGRRSYAPESATFDLRQMRGPDLPFNKRIKLPNAVDEESEVRMQALKNNLRGVTSEYIRSQPNSTTLTKSEETGLRSLKKRIGRKEIVVFQTDKSGRFAVDSMENYVLSGQAHAAEDPIITEEDHRRIEHNINAHSVAFTRMTCAGESQQDSDRIRKNMIITDSQAPPLYTTRKDHKQSENNIIGPPTRPICGATTSANSRLSYMLNLIISEVWKRDMDTICMSTEELKSEIDRVNLRTINRKVIVGSTDIVALYPSLDIPFTIEKVCEVITESNLKFEGMWYEEIGLYIAIHYNRSQLTEAGIEEVCPRRATNRGRPPTVQSLRHERFEARHANWTSPAREPTDTEKRKMIVTALRILMTIVMSNHDYSFNGNIRKQQCGGPIGLDLTGSIAQIYMIWWDRELLRRLSSHGIDPEMDKRYVDDVTWVMRPVERGTRYINGQLEIVQEEIQPDADKNVDELTMTVLQQIANEIHPSTQVTIDYPSQHPDRKMPSLDLKLWTEETTNGTKVMHEHYSKPMSCKAVIFARSAMSWKVKRTVLTQEALRIMLNCSRDLPWNNIAAHLSIFTARMQFSGYNQQFRAEVVKSALNAYACLRDQENRGERPLYRPKMWNARERDEEKKSKKLSWYKRGGDEALMIIPQTPNSRLLKLYREEVRRSGLGIYITEKGGTQLKRQLQRSNPFLGRKCERPDCLVCTSDGKGSCRSRGVNYTITCKECEEQGRQERTYIGETSRTPYIRGLEHQDGLIKKRDGSVLWKHCRNHHNGVIENCHFRMDVVGVYGDDAMLRQVGEGVRIQRSPPQQLMNDRSEWGYIHLPRVGLQPEA